MIAGQRRKASRIKAGVFLAAALLPVTGAAEDTGTQGRGGGKFTHRIEAEYNTGGILHTDEYLAGGNPENRVMNHSSAVRMKYAFADAPGSARAQIYKGAYQGAGIALHRFNPQLGNPVSVFIFQGARIVSLSRRLSLNYEWNLGLAYGWNPYDRERNPDNRVIGSKATAYLDADIYLCWTLSRWADVTAGVAASHFSNGNTADPNGGLNTLAAKVGMACHIGRGNASDTRRPIPPFARHVSCDVVAFGAWRRHGIAGGDGGLYAAPGTYGVFGINVNPMYNISHWLSAGVSLDGVYDRSANMYFEDGVVSAAAVRRPAAEKQMALGLSARAELVMPYFTINAGVGTNVVNGRGDFSGVYEILALKINAFRGTFVHIGYCLNDFKYPNYLMLGVGYRFNDRRMR